MPKEKKINKKKLSNVVPLRKKLIQSESSENILSVEEQERDRTNKFARKICDEIDNYVRETKMDTDMTQWLDRKLPGWATCASQRNQYSSPVG